MIPYQPGLGAAEGKVAPLLTCAGYATDQTRLFCSSHLFQMPMTGPVPDLSIFLIAQNEADRIGRTLAAVSGLTDDLVVIDSGSTDDTVAIAKAHGARVLFNPWPGYGPQKRFAEDQCRHTWLLNIDADEWVPPKLAEELREVLQQGAQDKDGFSIPIAEVFPGEDAPHPFAYALHPVRLYRRDKGRYVDSTVHDRVAFTATPKIGRLKTAIHHFSVRSIGDQMRKLNDYTTDQAEDLARRGKHVPTWRLFVEFPASFLKAYIVRRHIFRGVYGLMTAMNYGFYRWLRVAKDVERRRIEAKRKREGKAGS
jgi:glycosyltransferase involved in cell wall biosynthesis